MTARPNTAPGVGETGSPLRHRLDRILSRAVRIDSVRSVCLALGPYRNLTTLTAGLIALHPNCQVLNHGGERIYGDDELNFIADYSDRRFRAFLRYAIRASRDGGPGQQGGSILHSHAFRRDALRDAFASRYGGRRVKRRIECLFWKESLRTANLIRERCGDLPALLDRNPRLRFLMPVRNPLDCALSNIKTGHSRLFVDVSDPSDPREVLRAVLNELAWFLDLSDETPGRFFHFFEDAFTRETLESMATFLEVSADPDWIEAGVGAFVLTPPYEHHADLRREYHRLVDALFATRPAVAQHLHRFGNAAVERPFGGEAATQRPN